MQIINVILWFIGVLTTLLFLCKLIFLTVLAVKRNGNPDKVWAIEKHSMISSNFEDAWFLIPTISVDKCSDTIEISFKFLKWEYYTNYKLSNEV